MCLVNQSILQFLVVKFLCWSKINLGIFKLWYFMENYWLGFLIGLLLIYFNDRFNNKKLYLSIAGCC